MKPLIAVAMSGGIDSSVSALLLKEQGYPLIGLFMKNWEEGENCPAAQDYADASAVCAHLGIPCYSFNFSRHYWDRVFEVFLAELRAGLTPNPDILCNREIKFHLLFDKARELGASYLATGHYARSESSQLLRGVDANKDQTYFLYTLQASLLPHLLFPVGGLLKRDVRAIARSHGLITSEKKESMGICFIGKRDFKSFVGQYIAYHPGEIVDLNGKVVGHHSGVAYYTVGQRHGLAIGGAGAAWFVAGKELATNRLFVVQGEEHPALFRRELIAVDLSWVGDAPPEENSWRCSAKVRYRQSDQPCQVTLLEGKALVIFDSPQRAVTPGQAIVFYHGDCCLGGGSIRYLESGEL